MEDHHVDRPGVEAQQCVKLTGTNRSFGLIQSFRRMQGPDPRVQHQPSLDNKHRTHCPQGSGIRYQKLSSLMPDTWSLTSDLPFRRPGGHGEGPYTRSHPELGRENPQRQWYCVLRRGRVGRRQVFRTEDGKTKPQSIPIPTQSATGLRAVLIPDTCPLIPDLRGVEQPGSSSGS